MDEIRIKRLEVFAHHGVFPEENQLGQKFLVSAVLYTDLRRAGLTDELSHSMDYGAVCAEIHRYLTEHTFRLLETAAERLCAHLLRTLPQLARMRLEIEKPWAPIGLPLETASVCITRGWHTAYVALGSNLGDKTAYLDGAVQALQDYYPGKKVVFLTGMMKDKDSAAMLAKMGEVAKAFVCLHADSERAFGAQELAREIENTLSLAAYPAASAQEGCALAQRLAGEQGVVCALGSLYLAGEIRAVFHRE